MSCRMDRERWGKERGQMRRRYALQVHGDVGEEGGSIGAPLKHAGVHDDVLQTGEARERGVHPAKQREGDAIPAPHVVVTQQIVVAQSSAPAALLAPHRVRDVIQEWPGAPTHLRLFPPFRPSAPIGTGSPHCTLLCLAHLVGDVAQEGRAAAVLVFGTAHVGHAAVILRTGAERQVQGLGWGGP